MKRPRRRKKMLWSGRCYWFWLTRRSTVCHANTFFSLYYSFSFCSFVSEGMYNHCFTGSSNFVQSLIRSDTPRQSFKHRCSGSGISFPAIGLLFQRKHSTFEEKKGVSACSHRSITRNSGKIHISLGKLHGPERIIAILRSSKHSARSDFDDDCREAYLISTICGQTDQAALAEAEKIYKVIRENSSPQLDTERVLVHFRQKLTHSVVLQVLARLREAPNLALRFFSWASQQAGHRHDSHSCNTMIDILGKAGQFDIAHCLLDEMKGERSLVTVDTFVILMRRYAAAHKPREAEQVFHQMVYFGGQRDIAMFNVFLDSLCKNKLTGEARVAFLRLKHKFSPDRKSYSILLSGCCRSKNLQQAGNIIIEMMKEGFSPNVVTYNTILNAFCKQGYLSQALELWDLMKNRKCNMNVATYTTMIQALGLANKTEESFRVLAQMQEKGCSPNIATYSSLITGLCTAGKLSDAYRLLDEMAENGPTPDSMTYNCILKALCRLQKGDEALSLLEKMERAGCMPSIHAYKMLLKMFCKLGQLDVAFGLWNGMDTKCSAPDADCYSILIDGLFGRGRIQEALDYFHEMLDKGIKVQDTIRERFLSEFSKAGKTHISCKICDNSREVKSDIIPVSIKES